MHSLLFNGTGSEMPKSRMTTKGQVTIPKQTRQRLGLEPGDEVEFSELQGEIVLHKVAAPSPFSRYRGFLHKLAGRSTDDIIEEMRGR